MHFIRWEPAIYILGKQGLFQTVCFITTVTMVKWLLIAIIVGIAYAQGGDDDGVGECKSNVLPSSP